MRELNVKNKLRSDNSGYSLIQIAIGLVVLGVFVGTAGHAYVLYTKQRQIETTNSNVTTISNAIETFRKAYGRYPCPAEMDVARDNADYGDEAPSCLTQTVAIGNCQDGICIEQALDGTNYRLSTGVTFPTPDRGAALANDRIVIGTIPFRLLQLDEKKTYDAYGARLLYAVSESMTDRATFNPLNGAIHMVNAQGESLLDPPGSAPFLVLSHGPNNRGGYSTNGSMIEECGGSALDAENCFVFDPATVTLPPILPVNPPLSVFVAEYRSDALGNTEFDDVIDYFIESESPKWMRTVTDTRNIEAIVQDGVGVNTLAPTDALTIPLLTIDYDHDNDQNVADVVQHIGGLRAENSIQAQAFCQPDGSNCFDPRRLGGDVAEGMGCTNPGEYMVGIQGGGAAMGEAICAPVRLYCNSDSTPVLQGVNASGDPTCVAKPLAPCNGLSVQLCSGSPLAIHRLNSNQAPITNPISMVDSNHNAYVWATDPASYAPNQRRARFRCNNGVWSYYDGQAGICSCTVPADTSPQWVNAACPGESPSGNAALVEQVWDATNCTWANTGNVDYAACLCPGPVTAQPADIVNACGVGYNSGNDTTTFAFNNANNVCAWQPSGTNTCTCDAAVEGTTDGGTRTDTTPYLCNTVPGFEGYFGTAYRIQTFNATPGACNWSNTGWDTSGCACDTTTEHFSHLNSVCDLNCEDENRKESWYYRFIIDGGGNCVPGTPYLGTGPNDSAICQPSDFKWRDTGGAPGNEVEAILGPKMLDPCTCAQKGQSNSCWIETSPGKYRHFPCACQK